ncbi:MAG: MBL fold metallo-hydrolase [Actinobacteria bacterium]|nr:MBL fold metallo-hydrolase [Actinomycetota bacterium]
MRYLAPGVWRLKEIPAPTINCYLAEDVLIDAGRRWDRRRIFAELDGVEISMLALTHVHPDHQGVAKDVCEARGVPLACHADDVEAMEGRRPVQLEKTPGLIKSFEGRFWEGPPHHVDRVLSEGDVVAGFRVVHAPGHTRGEVIFFRERDRVAICGDVIRNMSFATGRPGMRELPEIFTEDPVENRRSIRKLAELNPSLILPGHGPAVTDMAAFERFVAALPA